jgi:hypothetical protein
MEGGIRVRKDCWFYHATLDFAFCFVLLFLFFFIFLLFFHLNPFDIIYYSFLLFLLVIR